MPGRIQFIFNALALVLMLGFSPDSCSETHAGNLKDQIERLARSQGISVKNLHLIQSAPPLRVDGSPEQQLKYLLNDYNFAQLSNRQGHIEKIIITSIKRYENRPTVTTETTKTEDHYSIKTSRNGSHHLVKAELSGPKGAKIKTTLLIDTGATTIVLPASQQAALGFSERNLQPGISETANGPVEIMQGKLKSVTIGKAQVDDVAVSFIDNDQLRSSGLLGMSFLGRFQVTFDDADNRITLKPYQ